jgi:hypothetical protein
VSNMALYLSMDVVDASFAQLRGAIAAARDFSAADAAHRQYVDSLVSQVGGGGGGGGGASNVRLKPDGSLKLSVLLVSAGSSHWVMGGACLPLTDAMVAACAVPTCSICYRDCRRSWTCGS